MSFSDVDRLDAERAQPRVLELHLALAKLQSCVSFMNTGAHPDDETSAMLAALGYRDGVDISYACANRGESGKNDIGTETLAALGTLRTAEMERAATALDLRLYWLSDSPEDSIFDFGFSKSGEQTLRHWQYPRTLHRFVSIVRRERPDIICPSSLDIPGQHGHHRAMTALTHEVMNKAADAAYECDKLPAWSISKLYLPAWSGGTACDDEQPPPPATLTIHADSHDAWSGWTWENIGQQSRGYHRTQGMGRWIRSGKERNWSLHLADSRVAGPDDSIFSGVPSTLADLADHVVGSPRARDALLAAHEAIDMTLQAFPNFPSVGRHACRALVLVQSAIKLCPIDAQEQLLHRLKRKQTQLSRVIRLALGVRVHAHFRSVGSKTYPSEFWQPGERRAYDIEVDARLAQTMGDCHVSACLRTAAPWQLVADTLVLDATATPSCPYPDTWLPDQPKEPYIEVRVSFNNVISTSRLPLDTPPVVLPATRATLFPQRILINTTRESLPIRITGSRLEPDSARPEWLLPDGWQLRTAGKDFLVQPPTPLANGLYQLSLTLDGRTAMQPYIIDHPHISARALNAAARVQCRAASVYLPTVRVAYVGGGSDDVGSWLETMGLPVRQLGDADLEAPSSLSNCLADIDTLVVGLFAYRSRPQLAVLSETINDWVRQGGHLLTLYHRPWDNWDAQRTPPLPLEIGQPSLRYRVTDENAEVHYLVPKHPLLNTPNVIGPEDWAGWHTERGLYFAKHWDEAYQPLLSMADPGEAAHSGALLCADIGKGRHIHTSLTLHHQMNQLVPGSFRLMANLVS